MSQYTISTYVKPYHITLHPRRCRGRPSASPGSGRPPDGLPWLNNPNNS